MGWKKLTAYEPKVLGKIRTCTAAQVRSKLNLGCSAKNASAPEIASDSLAASTLNLETHSPSRSQTTSYIFMLGRYCRGILLPTLVLASSLGVKHWNVPTSRCAGHLQRLSC